MCSAAERFVASLIASSLRHSELAEESLPVKPRKRFLDKLGMTARESVQKS
jgi:hypothetical protein